MKSIIIGDINILIFHKKDEKNRILIRNLFSYINNSDNFPSNYNYSSNMTVNATTDYNLT